MLVCTGDHVQICWDIYDLNALNYKHVHILNALKRRVGFLGWAGFFGFGFFWLVFFLAAKVKNEGRKQFSWNSTKICFFIVSCSHKLIIAIHSLMPKHLGFSSFGEKERKWMLRFWEVLGRSRMRVFPLYPEVQWLHDICELHPTFFPIYLINSCPRTIF